MCNVQAASEIESLRALTRTRDGKFWLRLECCNDEAWPVVIAARVVRAGISAEDNKKLGEIILLIQGFLGHRGNGTV